MIIRIPISAFQLYSDHVPGSTTASLAENFKRAFSRKHARVHFLGAWLVQVPWISSRALPHCRINFFRDTVSSVGIFRRVLPSVVDSSDHICIFRHALALDERRVKFQPEYIYGGASHIPNEKANGVHDSDIKEVWFAGCHSDMSVKQKLGSPIEHDLYQPFFTAAVALQTI